MLRGQYAIKDARPSDLSLIKDSWRRSLQDAPAYSAIPARGYAAYVNDVIGYFLGGEPGSLTAHPDDQLLVACDVERPMYVYGWILARDLKPGLALVYVYVKSHHRREGVASELLATVVAGTDAGPMTYAFRTRVDPWFEDCGLTFEPVENLQYGKRVAS